MRWFWSAAPDAEGKKNETAAASNRHIPREDASTSSAEAAQSLLAGLTSGQTLVSTLVLTGTILLAVRTYKHHLRRIPTEAHLNPRRHLSSQRTTSDLSPTSAPPQISHSLFGRVTSVGDADNFRFYHTPGGRLAGFHWLRRVPTSGKELRNQTLHVRIAGIDAPELAHFGKPAQPYSAEALAWLKDQLQGRDVRVWLHRRDQYGRVVGSTSLRRAGVPGLPRRWMRDVGFDMIRTGWATVYEAKFGAEFGGREAEYRQAEALAKKQRRGMWGGGGGIVAGSRRLSWLTGMLRGKSAAAAAAAAPAVETPRQYKTRMRQQQQDGESTSPSPSAGSTNKR